MLNVNQNFNVNYFNTHLYLFSFSSFTHSPNYSITHLLNN